MSSANILLLLLFFSANVQLFDFKISSRLKKWKGNGNFRCTILFPNEMASSAATQNGPQLELAYAAKYWLDLCNCTVELKTFDFNGKPDENGTYDGWIGMIQRDEYDFGFAIVRPDSLPFEPVKIGPPTITADETIVTRRAYKAKTEHRQITSFLHLDICVYAYAMATCFYIFPIVFTFFQLEGRDKLDVEKFCQNYFNNCYRVFTLLVDQEQFITASLAGHILVLAMSLFCLTAIFGTLLNTVGADLVVIKPPPVIDSLDELLESTLTPLISRNFYSWDLIQNSPPGSKLSKLWQRVNQNLNESTFILSRDNEMDNLPMLSKQLDRLNRSEIALLIPQSFAKNIPEGLCLARKNKMIQDLGENIHIAKELFAPGTLNAVYSHKTHPFSERMMLYLLRTVHEAGILAAINQITIKNVPKIASGSDLHYNLETIKCMEKKSDMGSQPFIPFSTEHLQSLFEIWAHLCTFASIIHILQVSYDRFWAQHVPRFRRRKIIKLNRRIQPMITYAKVQRIA